MKNNSILTYTGILMNASSPKMNMIDIIDIAHALSCQPRFGGHLEKPYSVAQHSVMCARGVEKRFKLQALLHDGSEAYILDMPSPIKQFLPDYKKMEDGIMKVIAKKFSFNYPLDLEVKYIDREMLLFEQKYLSFREELLPKGFKVWSQKKAKKEFLKMFERLTK